MESKAAPQSVRKSLTTPTAGMCVSTSSSRGPPLFRSVYATVDVESRDYQKRAHPNSKYSIHFSAGGMLTGGGQVPALRNLTELGAGVTQARAVSTRIAGNILHRRGRGKNSGRKHQKGLSGSSTQPGVSVFTSCTYDSSSFSS